MDFGPAGPSRPNATMLLETVRLAQPNAAALPCGLCQCERQNKLCKKQGAGIDQNSLSSNIGHTNESQRGSLVLCYFPLAPDEADAVAIIVIHIHASPYSHSGYLAHSLVTFPGGSI